MRKKSFVIVLAVFVCCVVTPRFVSAININLVYPGGNLFSASHDPAAKAAINAAAADISSAINTSLSSISTDVYTGTNGSTTATLDWAYQLENPVTGLATVIDPATIAANSVVMHVGARNLAGTTPGIGAPNGAGFQLAGSGFPGQWIGAVSSAESQSENAYLRGAGPRIGTLSGSTNLGGTVANYSMDYGIAYGSLAFDWDGNNNGVKDSDVELNNYWHFDHTASVAAGKRDLYSVALHEMLHALGIGASDSWDAKILGNDWTGTEVINLYGTGANLISSSHVAEGIMSTRITDGIPQEVAMDPTIVTGSRKLLTALDLAFLRDIGYTTVPEPNALTLLLVGSVALLAAQRP